MDRNHNAGRIVVGIDGSKPSQRALQWAAETAVRHGSSLDVVHAWKMPYSFHDEVKHFDVAAFKAEAQTVLDDAIASLAGLGRVVPSCRSLVVHEDDAALALLGAAEDAELLVVGSRGRGGFAGLLLGSVSRRCLEYAPCPVAVVPPGWEPDGDGRVVVGIDGSQPSYRALHWAVNEAVSRNARLDVVNASHYHLPVAPPFGLIVAADRDELDKASRRLLEEMVGGALRRGEARPPDVELIASPSSAARALLETADGADLLVVGSRGRGAFRGMLLGSVSQQCVHHARCPVVVVHPQPTGNDHQATTGPRGP
jgi:nucleotide-binding universal stress UspA family protein